MRIIDQVSALLKVSFKQEPDAFRCSYYNRSAAPSPESPAGPYLANQSVSVHRFSARRGVTRAERCSGLNF